MDMQPGPDGMPIPAGTNVLRAGLSPSNMNDPAAARLTGGKAWPGLFILSTADRAHQPPRLSTWLTALTTIQQAWVLTGSNPKRKVFASLSVDLVRNVFAPAHGELPATKPLNVEWERAMMAVEGSIVPDTRPGYEGHCGISGLDDSNGNKPQREMLRSKLCEAVTAMEVLSDERIELLLVAESF